jgi:hypothetical protein
MNEILRRAILGAGLDEVDVAARLEVDPKTVRRWLEGRVPYSRHRWALADLLNLDQAALWPESHASQPRSDELTAVHPHRSLITRETWMNLLKPAKREISILDYSSMFLAVAIEIHSILIEKAQSGVRIRVAFGTPDTSEVSTNALSPQSVETSTLCELLRQIEGIEIRLYRDVLYNSIYRADDRVLCGQHIYGFPPERSPVLDLTRKNPNDMAQAYIATFDRVWAVSSRPDM